MRVRMFVLLGLFCAPLHLYAQNSAVITPPQVEHQTEAVYPPQSLLLKEQGKAVLKITVSAEGRVSESSVHVSSGSVLLDQAALDAVKTWVFKPAMRNDTAVASVLHVPFVFTLPAVEEVPVAVSNTEKTLDVWVQHRGVAPRASAFDLVLDPSLFNLAPHQTAADLLASAPGLYVARPEGEGVAHQVFLRGFDAEHGQDIAFKLGSMPLNQPSHIHGQGYADLNFIIPETVLQLRVQEGVYDVRQGDFAVAGSATYDLGVAERGVRIKTGMGSFGTFKQWALWAPHDEDTRSFVGVYMHKTRGFGTQRAGMSGSVLGQWVFQWPQGYEAVLQAGAYGARFGLAGVLRYDDVQSGVVDFYGTYNHPTASGQNAFSSRAHLALTVNKQNSSGSQQSFSAWAQAVQYRSLQNFTGFMQHSRTQPTWIGRGDLFEQTNQDIGVGAEWNYQSAPHVWNRWLRTHFSLGASLQSHMITQAQNLVQAPNNKIWDTRVDARIGSHNIASFGDIQWNITKYVQWRTGLRADLLYFNIHDALGNFIPPHQKATHTPGYTRTALGLAYGPRTTLEINPHKKVQVFVSYGQGYRSPQARQLDEGEKAPFTKVHGMETGVHWRAWGEVLQLKAAGFATFLSDDTLFDATEGRVERVGKTSRKGVSMMALSHPWKWLQGTLSATYTKATLDEAAEPTAENPQPLYRKGQDLPYVPPWVVRADVKASYDLATVRKHALTAYVGSGVQYLSARPLPYGASASPVRVWDASVSLRWNIVECGLDVYNVLNTRYATTEYSYVSQWDTSSVPSRIPARHFSAGAPRTFMGTCDVHF